MSSQNRRATLAFYVLLCCGLTPACAERLPRLFAPEAISSPAFEFTPAFTPDGNTCYFLRFAAGMKNASILESHFVKGKWTTPTVLRFSGSYPDGSPALSPDGAKLFFASHRPLPGEQGESEQWHIWYSGREAGGWADPKPVPSPVLDKKKNQTSPSVTAQGTLYYCANNDEQGRGWDIYRARFVNETYTMPEPVGVNSTFDESSAWVLPDESLILYSSIGRREGAGESDLYESDLKDTWPPVYRIPQTVNTTHNESHPRLSPDGKALFFTRDGDVYAVEFGPAKWPDEHWSPRAPMLNGRIWPQAVVSDGKIYVYGGLSETRSWVKAFEEYDAAAGKWRQRANPPEGWTSASLVVSKGEVYLLRRNGAGVARYDRTSDQWRQVEAADEPVIHDGQPFQIRTVSVSDRVYMVRTGDGDGAAFCYFAEFDFSRMRWIQRASMPFSAAQLVAVAGRIYAFGGGNKADVVEEYDPAKDAWTLRSRMPVGRWETALAALNGTVFAIGGHDMAGYPAEPIDEYDAASDRWTGSRASSFRIWGATAVTLGGRIFLIGGALFDAPRGATNNKVFEYAPSASRLAGGVE